MYLSGQNTRVENRCRGLESPRSALFTKLFFCVLSNHLMCICVVVTYPDSYTLVVLYTDEGRVGEESREAERRGD